LIVTTTSDNASKAAIYCRISDDREGRENGVTRQQEDCRALAAHLGLTVDADAVFVDNDISASAYARKVRPRYRALLKDARAGLFGTIIAYTSGRLTRKPREHEDLIELGQTGITFQYVASPSFDLNTADGRAVARTLGAWDAAEAERIGERVRRNNKQRVENGLWHGGPLAPVGHLKITGPDGKTVGLKLDPLMCPLLREGAKRLLAGESQYAVMNDWNHKGLLTRTGAMWRSSTLRRALLSPTMIGMREHDGKLYPTGWPAILDRETWDRVRNLFENPSRRFQAIDGSYASKRALGGGVTLCGDFLIDSEGRVTPCRRKFMSQRHRGVPRLICHKQATGGCGHVTIGYEPYERFVLDMMMERLDSSAFRKTLKRRDTDAGREERSLRMELADLEGQRGRVGDAVVIGAYTAAEGRAKIEEIESKVFEISDRLSRITASLVLTDVHTSADALRLWDAADVSRRRRLVQSMIEEIVVTRYPAGMATTLSRRRNESDDDFEARKFALQRAALRERVTIKWRV